MSLNRKIFDRLKEGRGWAARNIGNQLVKGGGGWGLANYHGRLRERDTKNVENIDYRPLIIKL